MTTEHPRHVQVPGPQLPGIITGVTLLAGIWLLLGPFVDVGWNDLAVGLALVAVGVTRMTRSVRLMPVTVVSVLLGVWLAIAPFALAYNLGAGTSAATVNDTIVGTLVTGLALAGYLHARDTTAQPSNR